MKNAQKLAGGSLVLLLATFIATDLPAQIPGGMRQGGRSRSGESGRGTFQAPQPTMNGDTVELVEFRLNMLEEDLKLTQPQLKAFDLYAERVRAMAADAVRERAPAQTLTPPTAMQQLNRSLDVARDRLTALEDVAAATKTLYDRLSPEQKMLVDARMPTILPLIAGSNTRARNTTDGTPPPTEDGNGNRPRDGDRGGRRD